MRRSSISYLYQYSQLYFTTLLEDNVLNTALHSTMWRRWWIYVFGLEGYRDLRHRRSPAWSPLGGCIRFSTLTTAKGEYAHIGNGINSTTLH